MSLHILKKPSEIIDHLHAIKKATDANKDIFGFMTEGAYRDAIKNNKLWVAVNTQGVYLGHIMHGGKIPQEVRVFQIYVAECYRGIGVADFLLEEITKYAEDQSCLNLRADVASDLNSAMKFWQSRGFCALAPRKKVNTTGREVLLFYKRLSTPSLIPNEPLSLSILSRSAATVLESYVIDLNIFLTLLKNRENEEIISEIMQASMAGEFSIFVTPEFQEELRRSKKAINDPIFDLAEKTLPVLDVLHDSELYAIEEEIRGIVFPGRNKESKSAKNNESDIRHLAYCIQHSKVGFITEEKAMLKVKHVLKDRYGLRLYSPEDFKVECTESINFNSFDTPLASKEGGVSIQNVKKPLEIELFFKGLGQTIGLLSNVILKNSIRGIRELKSITVGDNVQAVYASNTAGVKHDTLEGFFVSKSDNFTYREIIFQHILELFMRHAQAIKASNIKFYIREEDFDFEKSCILRGFVRSKETVYPGMIALTKLPCPLLISKSNWIEFTEVFSEHTSIQPPRIIPDYKCNIDNQPIIHVAQGGRDYEFKLFELETFLSPSVMLLPKRNAVMLPIGPGYSESLLVRSEEQLPFALTEDAILRFERAYFHKPRNTKMFEKGMPILFYESRSGRGVVGCARITSIEIVSFENALKLYRKQGVLDSKKLAEQIDKNGNVQVITFDNFKVFSAPVPLKRLHELGCARANMVGPEKLSFEQLSTILHEGTSANTRDVLLSIQPNYVNKILNGKKTIELRKKPFPINGGVRVWIYTTSPVCAVELYVVVSSVDEDTPNNIWKRYKNKCGISKEDFDSYYNNSKVAYALHLSHPKKLNSRMKLQELKDVFENFTPPQYYRYVQHNSALFNRLIEKI